MAETETQVKAEASVSFADPVVVEAPSNDNVPNKASETAKDVEESKAVAAVDEPESEFHLHVHVLLSVFQ